MVTDFLSRFPEFLPNCTISQPTSQRRVQQCSPDKKLCKDKQTLICSWVSKSTRTQLAVTCRYHDQVHCQVPKPAALTTERPISSTLIWEKQLSSMLHSRETSESANFVSVRKEQDQQRYFTRRGRSICNDQGGTLYTFLWWLCQELLCFWGPLHSCHAETGQVFTATASTEHNTGARSENPQVTQPPCPQKNFVTNLTWNTRQNAALISLPTFPVMHTIHHPHLLRLRLLRKWAKSLQKMWPYRSNCFVATSARDVRKKSSNQFRKLSVNLFYRVYKDLHKFFKEKKNKYIYT